jgi:hypothetical protein
MTSRQRHIIAMWEAFENHEPDISTERLMAMVACAGHTDVDEVCAALEAEAEEKP